jgi:hypothetical protein
MGKGSKKKPPPDKPDWQKLEVVIEEIHKFLAPGAEVRRNHIIIGKSGRRRQLDVTVSQRLASTPIFLVIECKRYKRPVGIEKVEAFVTKLKDVGAFVGVIISSSGFDAGATAAAAQHTIYLKTYREADDTDFWQRFIQADSWASITTYQIDLNAVSMILEDERQFNNIPTNLILLNEQGSHYREINGEPWTVEDEFFQGFHKAQRPRPIGQVELTLGGANPPYFTRYYDDLVRINRLIIRGIITPKRYPVNLRLISGHLLETAETRNLEYIRARLGPLDIGEIIENQNGITFSNEEWIESEQSRTVENIIPSTGRYDIYVEASINQEQTS